MASQFGVISSLLRSGLSFLEGREGQNTVSHPPGVLVVRAGQGPSGLVPQPSAGGRKPQREGQTQPLPSGSVHLGVCALGTDLPLHSGEGAAIIPVETAV